MYIHDPIILTLSRGELDALMEWHRDQEYKSADKRNYSDADYHARRLKELTEVAKTPRAAPAYASTSEGEQR